MISCIRNLLHSNLLPSKFYSLIIISDTFLTFSLIKTALVTAGLLTFLRCYTLKIFGILELCLK